MSSIFSNSPVRVNLTKAQIEALIKQEVGRSFPNFSADEISFKVSTQTDMSMRFLEPLLKVLI
jgi:hypothetical protein